MMLILEAEKVSPIWFYDSLYYSEHVVSFDSIIHNVKAQNTSIVIFFVSFSILPLYH